MPPARPRSPTPKWPLGAAAALLALLVFVVTQLHAQSLSPAEALIAARGEAGAPKEPPARAKLLELYMLDVGQGDGLIIRSPEGKVVLLDAGPRDARGVVLADLAALGIKEIDLAIGSHPHEDHIGSMADVIEAIPVKRFIDPGFAHTSITYQNLLRTLEQKQIPYGQGRRGQQIDLKGGVMMTFLAPEDPLLSGTRSDANSNSMVARLTFGEFSALLTGDAEHDTEQRMLRHPEDRELLRATVLKVAHHGGRYSTYADFLDAVAPSLALISSGEGNSYGHPSKVTLNKLDRRGIVTLRTDERGTLRLRTDGQWIWADALSAPSSSLDPSVPPTVTATPIGVFPARAAALSQALPPAGVDEDDLSAPQEPDAHDAQRAPAAAVDAADAYVASKSSDVFHKMSCGNARRITTSNQRLYTSRDAAIADGKRPAHCCNP